MPHKQLIFGVILHSYSPHYSCCFFSRDDTSRASSRSVNEDDDDKAKILAKSFIHSSEEPNLSVNPMTTFDNPTYDSTPTPVDDVEVEKEDLSMIGKPISYEDDIEL